LKKSLNFAIAPRVPPKFEFIKAIEAAAVKLYNLKVPMALNGELEW
jgi:hypothetical protein